MRAVRGNDPPDLARLAPFYAWHKWLGLAWPRMSCHVMLRVWWSWEARLEPMDGRAMNLYILVSTYSKCLARWILLADSSWTVGRLAPAMRTRHPSIHNLLSEVTNGLMIVPSCLRHSFSPPNHQAEPHYWEDWMVTMKAHNYSCFRQIVN